MDTTINTGTNLALQRLMTWLSPAFPVGAFAYSAGLETAIVQKAIINAEQLQDWLCGTLNSGSGFTDAIILAQAHRADSNPTKLRELADFCHALTPSSQRIQEMDLLGNAFIDAARAWPTTVHDKLPSPCPYAVAVGAIAGSHNIPLLSTLTAYLTAFAHAQISVAVRLVPLGQTDGLHVLADLEPTIAAIASDAASKTLDDIGSIAYAADIAAMRHETLRSRIFRS